MAKKKNIKNAAHTDNSVKSKSPDMRSKVEIKQPLPQNQERISRLVGSVFIGMGVLLVAFGIYSFIRYREEPLFNPDLEAPTLDEVTSITNGDKIMVKGSAAGFDEVFVYVNEEKIDTTKLDDDSKFSYEYIVDEEGEYAISVAGVKGFPNRTIGPRSTSKIAIADWTAPSQDSVTLRYGQETNKNTFTLAGTTEGNASVEVKRGTESFGGLSDSKGNFRIEGIALDEGKNVFSIYVEDSAGNQVTLDEKIRVSYSPTGTVNGDAVVDEDIPQAAGAFDTLFGNQLMMLFGLIALIAFGVSSSVVYIKNKK
ncbi:MAG: hypothetical protein UR49_C0024G0006 [candidate division WS6 bacterium GW2011_GWF2_33_92]|uniref:Bacterial Ig-like domain-containing protein n=1 Tax=candidate division WS6 bacterium GW2011_GWB1_33_6 TaxID=1619088 RepID=A0A0G0AD50_9BACT|nr:MAG: hypothetical protein UR47_C0011G0008 [candidate division WS6 bacterium GW2011_GWB1_33_6]KKP55936.1 MAG: hypothetical protein UR49_C0024G0006 [candidate division WS6 bacterium GW2011_GWF2_33_92]HBB64979.1 hypothetical protein [Patescibacteria group bacterium]